MSPDLKRLGNAEEVGRQRAKKSKNKSDNRRGAETQRKRRKSINRKGAKAQKTSYLNLVFLCVPLRLCAFAVAFDSLFLGALGVLAVQPPLKVTAPAPQLR
ncbi:MAG TPA: hypothetical protein VFM11_07095 [Burkholderiales bacterium]|nr:hypothetical protein [Burkholderiales bacterium]